MSCILVADDDDSTRELIGLAIGRFLNYDYDSTKNIYQTIKEIILNDYKLVIINIHMYSIYENKIIRYIYEISSDTAIIAITNSDSLEFKNSILISGATRILNKPFSIKQMMEMVRQYA